MGAEWEEVGSGPSWKLNMELSRQKDLFNIGVAESFKVDLNLHLYPLK